jgi:hypothetical protein
MNEEFREKLRNILHCHYDNMFPKEARFTVEKAHEALSSLGFHPFPGTEPHS